MEFDSKSCSGILNVIKITITQTYTIKTGDCFMQKNTLIKATLISACVSFSAATIAEDDAGKKTYEDACRVCHDAGVANSPKFGDKEAWAPRIATGIEALYTTSLKGKGAMPAKGGRADISDEAVKAAVDYMVKNAS